MKNYYLFKFTLIITFFIFLPTTLKAADQTVALGGNIQSAIDAVAASGGGTVTLSSGTYIVTTPLLIKSNVTLEGSGDWGSKIQTNTAIHVINAYEEGLVNVIIQNLEIEGINSVSGGGIQITAQTTDHDNIQIINVHCFNTGWGVHIKGAKNLLIQDCLFEDNGAVGYEYYAHNMYLRRVYVAEVTDSRFMNSTTANGINISYSEDIYVHDCEISGNYFRGVRAANTDGFVVKDCIINNNGTAGIMANSEGVATTNVDFRRNCISGNGEEGIRGVNGVTGKTFDNNSYSNGTNYSLPSTVTQSGDISDSSIDCVFRAVTLNATLNTNGSVSLDWSTQNMTSTNQGVFRDTDSNASGRQLISNGVSGTSYTDNSAISGTTYWYWIKASDATGNINSNSASTNASVTLSATAGNGSVSLNWTNQNMTPTNQGVFRDTDSNASGRQLISNGVSGNSYTDNSAVNGTTYWYWIKATDASGNTNSNSSSATPSSSAKIGFEKTASDTEELLRGTEKVTMYPNPVSDELTIKFANTNFNTENTHIEIFTINGKKVMEISPKKVSEVKVKLSNLNKGIYIIKVNDGTETIIKKVVKL